MRLLVLGGTEFVGRAVVDEAISRGWDVTVLNRGNRSVPPGVTALRGDRSAAGGLAALAEGTWDAVLDTWSWAPRAVRDAANTLAGRVGHYVYISSRSVYVLPTPVGAGEDAPLLAGSPDDGDVEYPQAKVGGELAAVAAFGDRALLVRAGLVLGPYENVGRLPWWLGRMARGGPVLAPGPAEAPLQYVDARDLAIWSLDGIERGLGGPYNLVSPSGHTTMRELLETCVRVTGSQAELRWMDPEPILAAGVEAWRDLPAWLPPGDIYDSLHRASVDKAVADGLRCRPVAETVADTWAWLQSLDGNAPQRPDRLPMGLDPALEAKVLGDPGPLSATQPAVDA